MESDEYSQTQWEAFEQKHTDLLGSANRARLAVLFPENDERTISGGIPADPGCYWPYLDSDGHDHDCVRCDLMAEIDCDTKYPGERGTCCVCVEHGCEDARAERAKHAISETNSLALP